MLFFLSLNNVVYSLNIMEESNPESKAFFEYTQNHLQIAETATDAETQKDLLIELNKTFAGPGTRPATKQDWEAFHLLCSLNARLLETTIGDERKRLLSSLFTYESDVDHEKMRIIQSVSFAMTALRFFCEFIKYKNPIEEFIKASLDNMREYSEKQKQSFLFFQKNFDFKPNNKNEIMYITVSIPLDLGADISANNTWESIARDCGGRDIRILYSYSSNPYYAQYLAYASGFKK